jgi:hypothetical protein
MSLGHDVSIARPGDDSIRGLSSPFHSARLSLREMTYSGLPPEFQGQRRWMPASQELK